MTAPALEIRNLQKSFGAIQVANDIISQCRAAPATR
jgi:hypothetical protein